MRAGRSGTTNGGRFQAAAHWYSWKGTPDKNVRYFVSGLANLHTAKAIIAALDAHMQVMVYDKIDKTTSELLPFAEVK